MKNRLVLASGSPRRRDLMAAMGLDFEVAAVDVDEVFPEGMPVAEVPVFLASLKSRAYDLRPGEVVVAADTVVILDGVILGKPESRDEAIAMLRMLSGRTHTVITGVCVRSEEGAESFSVSTAVTFSELCEDEIEYYVDTCRPMDKAGAYGIQEWIGHVAIEKIEGSYNNVVGLPTEKLYLNLRKFLQE